NMNLEEPTAKNYKILNEITNIHQNEVAQRKARKLRRDESDYKNGRIFTFSRKYDHLIKRIESPQNYEAGSSSSLNSVSTNNSEMSGCSNTSRNDLTTQQGTPSFLTEVQRIRQGQWETNRRL
ncbi:hypothetical protein NDU88_005320, partial [Pleurodeles waltl]